MARRYDTQRIDRTETLPGGALRVAATLTRAGVFEYQEGGRIVREWRPLAEVQRADTLASFDDLPVTIGHPRAGVGPDNFGREAAGHVRAGSTKVEGRDANSTIIVARGDGVDGIKTRRLFDTSLGFDTEIDGVAGTVPEGEPDAGKPYDRVQRKLVANHVALLRRGDGRTGSTMRLDGADQIVDDQAEDETPMKKITIRVDGKPVEIEVADASAASVSALEAERDALTARADGQAKTIAERDAADAKARRAALEQTARVALGADFAFTRKDDKGAEVALTDDEIKVAVIKRSDASFDPAGRDSTYLAVRFDIAIKPGAAGTQSPAAPHLRALNGQDESRTDAANPDAVTDPRAYAAKAEAHNPLNHGLVARSA